MAAKPGDLAWAAPQRTIWLVHAMDEGTVIRESTWEKDRTESKRFKVGVRQHINANGLLPCGHNIELTDEECALVAREALLHD